MKKFDTIKEATQDWVREFNAFPQSMLKMICDATGYDTFAEVTTPSIGDRVYEYDNGEYGQIVDYDSEEEIYTIELDNGDICKDFSSSFERAIAASANACFAWLSSFSRILRIPCILYRKTAISTAPFEINQKWIS